MSVTHRVHSVHRMLRLNELPFEFTGSHVLTMPGFTVMVGGPHGYGTKHLSDIKAMEALLVDRPEAIPFTVKHKTGVPYQDAIVSMRARDWMTLMHIVIASDPDRYMIQKEN